MRQHLKNVYGCLSLSTVSAAAGAYVHMSTEILQAGLLSTFGALGLLIALLTTQDNGKNQKLRLSYLLGFAFLSGLGMGPLLEAVIAIDPSIVVTALVGECIFSVIIWKILISSLTKWKVLINFNLFVTRAQALWLKFCTIIIHCRNVCDLRFLQYCRVPRWARKMAVPGWNTSECDELDDDLLLCQYLPSLHYDLSGASLYWPVLDVRLYYLRHATHHREALHGQQGLYRPLAWSLHRLYWSVPPPSRYSHPEGNFIINYTYLKQKSKIQLKKFLLSLLL